MSQSRRTLDLAVAPQGARAVPIGNQPEATRGIAASNGPDQAVDLDNLAPGTGAVLLPGQRQPEARSLSLPITANRSLDDHDPEPDKKGCDFLRGRAFLNVETGQVVPARCGRNRCAYCLRANARRRARAIAWGQPERAILLTRAGDDWQTVRSRMWHLRHDLSAAVGEFQWVWHVEPNPELTGHHVHAWQRGNFVPQRLLSEMADGAGFGPFARVNKIRSTGGAGQYGLKGITYGLKGALADDEGVGYLSDNGWRLTHQSRRFFVDSDGEPRGVKYAERSCSDQPKGQWVLIAAEVQ